MPIEKLSLGPTPTIKVTCHASLDIRGSSRDDTRLESDQSPFTVEETEDGATVESPSNCLIRLPEGGSVHILEVTGSFRAKHILGSVVIDDLKGSCYVRQVGELTIGEIAGETRIREIAGPVDAGAIKGSLTVRDAQGPVRIESVFGDLLGRDVPGGMQVDVVRGDLALRSYFAPGTESVFGEISGNATFRVTGDTGVRFIVPAGVAIMKSKGLDIIEEDGRQIVQVGDGAATIRIEHVNQVTIKDRVDYEDQTSFAYSFAIGNELSDHLADLSEELETQSDLLETNLSATSERIRNHVEKRLNIARRQVEAAQRRIDREVYRDNLKQDIKKSIALSFGLEDDKPAGEPVSEEERMRVLQMLEEGKISVEEAQELLSALEGK